MSILLLLLSVYLSNICQSRTFLWPNYMIHSVLESIAGTSFNIRLLFVLCPPLHLGDYKKTVNKNEEDEGAKSRAVVNTSENCV